MREKSDGRGMRKGRSLLLSIVLVFCILGAFVYTVSKKISQEMYASAIQNLSESLDLIQAAIEATLRSEAEFQLLLAEEAALSEDRKSVV